MEKQKGFTMIELIIVIVILGILAALVIPRFAAFDKSARTASITSLHGAVWSASSIVHAQSVIEGESDLATSSVTIEGQSVDVVYGYPATATGGIDKALGTNQGFSYAGGQFDFSPAASARANCNVTYAQPTAANTLPSIQLTTTGC